MYPLQLKESAWEYRKLLYAAVYSGARFLQEIVLSTMLQKKEIVREHMKRSGEKEMHFLSSGPMRTGQDGLKMSWKIWGQQQHVCSVAPSPKEKVWPRDQILGQRQEIAQLGGVKVCPGACNVMQTSELNFTLKKWAHRQSFETVWNRRR